MTSKWALQSIDISTTRYSIIISLHAEAVRIHGLQGSARIAELGKPGNQVGLVSWSHIHLPSATFWTRILFSTTNAALDSTT